MIALAVCPTCKNLEEVFVEADCETCEERHLDLRCPCGRRFHATPNQVTYVQEETEEEKKEVPRVLTPPSFPGL